VVTCCYECGRTITGRRWIVAERMICDRCAEQVRDVVALAAALQISVYDLAVAVLDA
jgi:hypothetical protein